MKTILSILAVAVFYAADVAGAEATYPVGSVITVTEDGITVRYEEVAATQGAVITDDTPPAVDEFGYCVGLDAVTVCDPEENLDNI